MRQLCYRPKIAQQFYDAALKMSADRSFRDHRDANHFVERTASLLRALDPAAPALMNLTPNACEEFEREFFLSLFVDKGFDPTIDALRRDDDLLAHVFHEDALVDTSRLKHEQFVVLTKVFSRNDVLRVLRDIDLEKPDGVVTRTIARWDGYGSRLRDTILEGWQRLAVADEIHEEPETPGMGA